MADKRDRGKNFTDMEKDQLIEICMQSKNIIENKRTDKFSIKEKLLAWDAIKDQYNSIQVTGIREVKALKALYDGLKMKARKEKAEERVEIYKTGGGAPSATMTQLSQKIVGQLEPQFEPLSNPFDSSSTYLDKENQETIVDQTEIVVEVPVMSLPAQRREYLSPLRGENTLSSVLPATVTSLPAKDTSPTVMSPPDTATSPPATIMSLPQRKRKLTTTTEGRNEFYQIEHKKKLKILALEEQAAELKVELQRIKMKNAQKKQLILDMKLKRLLSK